LTGWGLLRFGTLILLIFFEELIDLAVGLGDFLGGSGSASSLSGLLVFMTLEMWSKLLLN
jgi:hypothetical protein